MNTRQLSITLTILVVAFALALIAAPIIHGTP